MRHLALPFAFAVVAACGGSTAPISGDAGADATTDGVRARTSSPARPRVSATSAAVLLRLVRRAHVADMIGINWQKGARTRPPSAPTPAVRPAPWSRIQPRAGLSSQGVQGGRRARGRCVEPLHGGPGLPPSLSGLLRVRRRARAHARSAHRALEQRRHRVRRQPVQPNASGCAKCAVMYPSATRRSATPPRCTARSARSRGSTAAGG